MSGNMVAKIGSFSNEEFLNHSLPALGRKNAQFSTFSEAKPAYRSSDTKHDIVKNRFKVIGPSFTDDSTLVTPEKLYPHKRLPMLTTGKKSISVISKSKSTIDIPPQQGNQFNSENNETSLKPKPNPSSEEKKEASFSNETFKEYYYQTMAGYSDGRTKTNQDAFYINISIKNSPHCSLFAVFDGHGPLGHKVSEFLKKHITGSFL